MLAPLTRVWYFLFLFHEAQFFMETFRCADGHSVSMLWCCRLCHGVEGQGHPQRPHLVCQQVFQPTVHHPLSICSPSATVLCPVPTPLFTVSPTVCPSLTHTASKSQTLLYCSVHSARTCKLCRLFNEGRDGDKGPTCPCLRFNTTEKK